MFKDFTVIQHATPNGVASKYFGGFVYKFKGDYPDKSDSEIKKFLLETSAKDAVYTVPFTLKDAISQAKQYSMTLIIGMNEVMEDTPLVSAELFGRVAGILADILIENKFNETNSALNLINEPCERWKMKEMQYVQYCYRTNDKVKGRFPLIISNEEYHKWDEKLIFGQTMGIPQRIFGVHHLSSFGYPPKWKNIIDAKTQANEWKVPIMCNEGGSWFKSYQSTEGHNINIKLMEECYKNNYLGFAICLPKANEYAHNRWKNLIYIVCNNDYTKIISDTNWSKFEDEIKKYKKELPIEEEDMKLEKYYYKGKVNFPNDKGKYGHRFLRACFGLFDSNVFEEALDGKVRQYQIDNNLLIDGIVGPETFGNMIKQEDFYKNYCWVHSLWARGL